MVLYIGTPVIDIFITVLVSLFVNLSKTACGATIVVLVNSSSFKVLILKWSPCISVIKIVSGFCCPLKALASPNGSMYIVLLFHSKTAVACSIGVILISLKVFLLPL